MDELQNLNAAYLVYPNPAKNKFTISSSFFTTGEIEIYNVLGEKIYSADYTEPTTVNCELFPKGIYFVKVSAEEKQVVKKLLIE